MSGPAALAALAMDVTARLDRLRAVMAGREFEALLVTRLPNVRYLTGFTGSAAMLLVGEGDALFVTDGRYADQAPAELAAAGARADVEVGATTVQQGEILGRAIAGKARLGLEDHGVTWAQQRQFAEWFAGTELVPAGPLVEDLRRVKDAGEVARIRAACAIADDALAAVLPRLAEGPTEREVALELDVAMRERGATGPSFETIVASGPNGALPHARPTDRRVGAGDLVVIDFGCVVDGYCSDMTRTVSVGEPGPDAQRLLDVVRAAEEAGRAAVRPGVECAEVDAAARRVIEGAGLGDRFPHSTGHGVGLEIHEAPRVAATARGTLLLGDVVTVEPGVYLVGVGGVRIEDTVVVTETGAESLNRTPKALLPSSPGAT